VHDTLRAVLDLVTAGEAFDDLVLHGLTRLPRDGEEIRTDRCARSPGGGAVITAVAAARLGLRCGVLAGLSGDAARRLRREGVRVRNLRRRAEPAAVTIALSTPRDRAFVTFNGMNRLLPDRIRAHIGRIRARHVHFAFPPTRCRPWIRVVDALRGQGTTTSWDFGWNPALRRDRDFRRLAATVDYLFLNRSEAIVYAGARTLTAALARWKRMPHPVVVKLGARGARMVGGGHDTPARGVPAAVVDTTGAGDTFDAGFLVARIRGADLSEALRAGNRLGAAAVRFAGGIV
jgi:sugar/nucleoside kinase (ribokinase family)